MAFNPFGTFRRNQKTWLVGATLLAMVSFLFLGTIIQLLSGRSGGGTGGLETYAECREFGKITNQEIHTLQTNRESLGRFLSVLYTNLAQGADETKLRSLSLLRSVCEQYNISRDAESLVNAWLIVQYAQTEGLSPNWDDMRNYLSGLTADHLTEPVFQKTLADTGLSKAALENLLARHIIEKQALERFSVLYSAVSPATRWDWFRRLYRQVTIEAAALPVAEFTGQVGEPSEAQLKKFFEEYKSKKHDPGLADSGLIAPAEIAFQYVVAEPNQKILDSVTEDEMKAYYEANKETQFRKPVKPLTDLPGLPGGIGSSPFPAPGKPIFNIPNPAEPPKTDETPKTPDVPEPLKTEETPKTDEIPKTEEVPKTPQTETSRTGALTRWVKYQTEEILKTEEPKAGETPKEEPKKDDVKKEDPKPENVKPEKTKPAETKHEETKPETPADLSVLYHPFDDVKTAIRETLAREKAAKGLPVIQEKMNEFAKVYNECFEQRKPVPPLPDLSPVAAGQNLELKTVPLGGIYAAMHTEFARGLFERNRLIRLYANIPVNFVPEIFPGTNGEVLLWVTDQKAEKKPEKLDDVRELAVRRWKEIEARPLAMKKAEELAAKLNTAMADTMSSKLLFSEVFKKETVVETEPFTWKTYGEGIHPIMAIMNRQQPVLGEVREKGVAAGNSIIDNKVIFMPGREFMEKVYSLRRDEAGAVFNQPQSMVYVVRVTRSSPSEDSLLEQFQSSSLFAAEYLYAGQPELMTAAYEAWIGEIQTKTGFRWIRKPERYGE